MDLKQKLLSRKFWLALSAMLASLGTGISGIIQGNQTVAIIGSCVTVISAAIYAFANPTLTEKPLRKELISTKVRTHETHIGHGRVICTIHLIHEHIKTYFHRL